MGVRGGRGGEYNGEEEWGEGIMGWVDGSSCLPIIYPHTYHAHLLIQVSKIFDPFMFLSLPLPIKKTRTLIVTLVRTDPGVELYRVRDN